MAHHGLNQPLAKAMSAIIFVDKDITQISKDSVVADNACQADLLDEVTLIQAEDQRISERPLRAFAWTAQCPVGACEKITDSIEIEPCRISADDEIIFM